MSILPKLAMAVLAPASGLSALFALVAISEISTAQPQATAAAKVTPAIKKEFGRPPARPIENQALVDLGRELFHDPQLSASGKTACASCHFADLGFGVLDARSRNDSGKLTSRKSQPLIGLGHVVDAPYGWDGRNPSLEAQAKTSVATGSMSMRETETTVKVEVIEERFRSNPAYVAKFATALPGAPINIDTIVQAVAAFERTLEPGIAPFDRWIEGDEQAISESAKRGFTLFNGKANCSACHSGWRFTDDKFHDIGTTTIDLGRGTTVKDDELMKHAFKTPTLRSVAVRPPYMHNASQATLADVMRHYEKGGIERASRSPMMMAIELTDQERLDLIAFMETLTGATDTARARRQ